MIDIGISPTYWNQAHLLATNVCHPPERAQ